jgi:hypothetical protein
VAIRILLLPLFGERVETTLRFYNKRKAKLGSNHMSIKEGSNTERYPLYNE